MPLADLTVITGANGSGKSSIYRSLRFLSETAHDGAIAALAREGGLTSTLWAGPEKVSRDVKNGVFPTQGTVRKHPIGLKLGFSGDEFGYALDLGLPPKAETAFVLDAEIKAEAVWHGPILRAGSLLAERSGPVVRVRRSDGWNVTDHRLALWSSIMSEVADAESAPEVFALKQMLASWRFYDHLRTDRDAPARQSIVGTRTPVLASDGGDLAAAIQTILESRPDDQFNQYVDRAFPGSSVHITVEAGRFQLQFAQADLLRALSAEELSEGTLRYLLLLTALLSPLPAPLLVLNEPETSLHPSMLPALADLVRAASSESQIIVVTHSKVLVGALAKAGAERHELVKENGETRITGQTWLETPRWQWPSR